MSQFLVISLSFIAGANFAFGLTHLVMQNYFGFGVNMFVTLLTLSSAVLNYLAETKN